MVITLGVIAYAWVTLSTVNSIDGIGLTASAGDDLQISVDGINFYSSLPSTAITDLFDEINLYDVTTTDNINFYRGGLNRGIEAVENLHYLSFDLWLQTTRLESDVYLYNNVSKNVDYYNTTPGTFVVSRGIYWMANETFNNGPDVGDVVTNGSVDRYYSMNAIRIGIIELIDEENNLDSRNSESLANLIFDPSEDPTRGFGLPYGAFSYFFRRANYLMSIPTVKPDTVYQLSQMDPNNPYQALDNRSHIATMQPTEVVNENERTIYRAKVRVNVWVEGWDVDAFDAIENDPVKIQLQFKLAKRFIN
jgi:hypothetical protein